MSKTSISQAFYDHASQMAATAARTVTREVKELFALQDKIVDFLLDNPDSTQLDANSKALEIRSASMTPHKST